MVSYFLLSNKETTTLLYHAYFSKNNNEIEIGMNVHFNVGIKADDNHVYIAYNLHKAREDFVNL